MARFTDRTGSKAARWALVTAVGVAVAGGVGLPRSIAAAQTLVPLAKDLHWPHVSSLVPFRGRVWFANSVKFINHNSADLYSYDPANGAVRFERSLFSQDAGDPVVHHGLLYWPFEDARFSAGHGEYMVTNGRDWRWAMLPTGQVFHVHAITSWRGGLYAATSAWRTGLQRSDDNGLHWQTIYEHPAPPRTIARITGFANSGNALFASLSAEHERGPKLLRFDGGHLKPTAGWPVGGAVYYLAAYRGATYGVNYGAGSPRLYRREGNKATPVDAFGAARVTGIAAGRRALWVVTSGRDGGALWRSDDGIGWQQVQRFPGLQPSGVADLGGAPYVGAKAPGGGMLLGPSPDGRVSRIRTEPPALPQPQPSAEPLAAIIDPVRQALAQAGVSTERPAALITALHHAALASRADVGAALSTLLNGPMPEGEVGMIGGRVRVPAARLARWYLLRAIGLNRHGRVPPALIGDPWTTLSNRAEKYFELPPAAAWVAAYLGQSDGETVGALIARLGRDGDPAWLEGDLVGALSVLTGQPFGYDTAAWRRWLAEGPATR